MKYYAQTVSKILESEIMRRRTFYFVTITLLFFGANYLGWTIQSQTKPFTMGQILRTIDSINDAQGNQKKVLSARVLRDVRQRGVNFSLTNENETLLRNEGASNELIEAIRQISPPVLTPTPTPITNGREMKNSIGIEFVRIPSGSFMMGSPTSEAGRNADEAQRRVTINYEFYIGKYEVTIGEWKRLMGDLPEGMKTGLDAKFKKSDKQPVVRVSWNDAKEFIRKLNSQNDGYNYRLPSEAEWEYAARAGTTTPFGIGDGINLSSSQANFDGNDPYGNASKRKFLVRTTNVGSYQPNRWGLYDMHGNVWEWVEDIWQDNYNDLPVDGSANLSRGDASQRVLRGGSWSDGGAGCRSAGHFFSPPSNRTADGGFRLAASPKQVTIKMK